jgi:phage terminase large subunit-like protein
MTKLHGPQDRRKKQAAAKSTRTAAPAWKRKKGRVARVVAFLESLPITKGILAGKKMKLLPKQREFIEEIYGSTPRRVKIAIKSEPRGNGKTGLLAGLCLCHLAGPEAEPRGEVYSAAYNKLQSALIFAEAKAIVEQVPELFDRVNIQRYGKVIEVLEGDGAGSIYEALSADDRRAHGLSPSLWIYDEFAQSKNTDLLDNLMTAMGKRSESLGVIISTQAANDQHPLSMMIDDALMGTDPSVYVQLTSAPDDADTFDEETWKACNPAWGIFLDVEEFRSQAARAQRVPSFRAKFENLRLNRRIDAETQYISDADWMACKGELDREKLKGRPCFAGLDLSQTTDMSAVSLFFPNDGGAILPHFWLPADGLMERDANEDAHYRLWRDRKLLETTPGKAINYKAIIKRLAEISTEYDLKAVAYDRAFIKTFNAQLDEEGVTLPMVEFGQGYVSMSPAVQLLEAAVLDKRVRHDGNPILRWHIANAAIEMDPAGNRKVTKKRSRGHVDGLVALLMAIGQHGLTAPKKASVYTTRGVLTIGGSAAV